MVGEGGEGGEGREDGEGRQARDGLGWGGAHDETPLGLTFRCRMFFANANIPIFRCMELRCTYSTCHPRIFWRMK